jgi:hypothetical protein
VPAKARPGTFTLALRCAATRGAVRHGKATLIRVTVRGGHGHAAPIQVRKVRLAAWSVAGKLPVPGVSAPAPSAPPASEHLSLTDDLPPGEGNPSEYSVSLPAGVGGSAFASYWPLDNGARTTITEGPGGGYSHYTMYTHDAVDLGIGTGTTIRAGFTGVVARVNRGCSVGDYGCGNGYGNYVYLKASDGTCAVMAHLSRIDVSPGQQLPVYSVVGASGTTGNSTGPHLHYDRVDCSNNRSMPWTPLEGGPLGEGATIVSQNHPPDGTSAPNPTPPGPITPPPPPPVYNETVGGVTHTWTNYNNAGGVEGPTIANGQTLQIACKLTGFRVADGNTWWYRIASSPWNGQYYASADAFYNNGATSGSLHGTPFVDANVRDC